MLCRLIRVLFCKQPFVRLFYIRHFILKPFHILITPLLELSKYLNLKRTENPEMARPESGERLLQCHQDTGGGKEEDGHFRSVDIRNEQGSFTLMFRSKNCRRILFFLRSFFNTFPLFHIEEKFRLPTQQKINCNTVKTDL